jgi:hypothetical protein
VHTSASTPPCELSGALAAWRQACCGPTLQAELRDFSGGKPLPDLPQLAALLCPQSPAANDLVTGLVAAIAGGLRDAPDQQVPLRHFVSDQVAMLILLRSGPALLSLQTVQRCAPDLPGSVVFSPVETHQHVLAGSGQAIRLDRLESGGDTGIAHTPLDLFRGIVTVCAGSEQCQVTTRVDQPLLVLRLQRALPGCEPAQLVDLQSGCVVQQAAGNSADTRLELTAAVIGQMDRRDAAPGLAAAALGTRSPAARWQALRAALALDSRIGFSALSALAERGDDPLAGPAQALCQQLRAAWPQLGEQAACR